MFKQSYTEEELDRIIQKTSERRGWDFSCMNTEKQITPWNYSETVKRYLKKTDKVLDIGTGGGEKLINFSPYFNTGIGIDIDPEMIRIANENKKNTENVTFYVDSDKLEATKEKFNVILNRNAPFNLTAINSCLKPGGIFITQQVGEKNMWSIKKALYLKLTEPVISKKLVLDSGLTVLEFKEYDVEYIVKDIESLVFWLKALDMLHADLETDKVISQCDVLNEILKNNIDKRGFITNEHRYLLIAQKP